MGVSEVPTIMPLARFAKVMGIDPIHFEGVFIQSHQAAVDGRIEPPTCDTPLFQYAWQGRSALGREEVAESIAAAERMLANEIGYWPAPTWIEDERKRWTLPARAELYRTNGRDPRGQSIAVQTDWAYWRVGGRRATTLISAAENITWSDGDGDGYDETGTITVVTAITDVCEVRIFYPGENGADRWEIRPITVVIAAGSATITFRRELAVDPTLLDAASIYTPTDFHGGIEGTVDANFLSTVDVYRVFNDPQSQAQMEWEPRPVDCDCGSTACSACAVGFQSACALPRGDLRNSWVYARPATWDATTETFTASALSSCRDPDHIRLSYMSGWRWEQAPLCSVTQMDPYFERIVARLAAAMLRSDLCGCTNVQEAVGHWRNDISRADSVRTFNLTQAMLSNPFGPSTGGLWAWQQIKQRTVRTGQAVLT